MNVLYTYVYVTHVHVQTYAEEEGGVMAESAGEALLSSLPAVTGQTTPDTQQTSRNSGCLSGAEIAAAFLCGREW